MHKLITLLDYFRYNSIVQTGPVTVTWFALRIDEEGDECGRPMTMPELNRLTDFMLSHRENFIDDNKNYHSSDEDDPQIPCCTIYDDLPDERRTRPSNIILRKNPVPYRGNIRACMDIILTNRSGADKQNVDLPFDIIGKLH